METGLEAAVEVEVDDDARGRRWRMPIIGGTMRSEHGSEMGCYAIVAMVVITCLVFQGKMVRADSRLPNLVQRQARTAGESTNRQPNQARPVY